MGRRPGFIGKKLPILERFESHVYHGLDSCWYWTSSTRNGYGVLVLNYKKIAAHRISYIIYKGEIPSGMVVCHSCDNPICVNPHHLFLGSPADNIHDMILKKRVRVRGKTFTEDYARSIKNLYDSGKSINTLSKTLNIARQSIRKMINRSS